MRSDVYETRRLARVRPRRVALIALLVSVAPVAAVMIDAEQASGAAPNWQMMARASAPAAAAGELDAVSCASAHDCFAVGAQITGTSQRTIVEHFDGSAWSVVAAPAPGTNSSLTDVACANAQRCVAVGFTHGADGSSRALIEQWNGTVWSTVTSPRPPGSTNTALAGIACPSAKSCFAVGGFEKSSSSRTLAEHWNGTRWSIMKTPPATSAVLSGVSCPTRTNCFAVGGVGPHNGRKPLVEYWNGTKWKVQASPAPADASNAGLAAVSCSSPKHCFAVGSTSRPGFVLPLGERWNGTKWSIAKVKDPMAGKPAIRITALRDVTCVSATNCFAVGYANRTLIEHWNGSAWKIQPSPSPDPYTEDSTPRLQGVTCTAGGKCFAVGVGNGTLVLRYP